METTQIGFWVLGFSPVQLNMLPEVKNKYLVKMLTSTVTLALASSSSLLVNVHPAEQSDGLSSWVPVTHRGHLDWLPGE